jgi:hypothetical protein
MTLDLSRNAVCDVRWVEDKSLEVKASAGRADFRRGDVCTYHEWRNATEVRRVDVIACAHTNRFLQRNGLDPPRAPENHGNGAQNAKRVTRFEESQGDALGSLLVGVDRIEGNPSTLNY